MHAGLKSAEGSRPQAVSESVPPRKTPVKAVVKRIGGGYSMKPGAAAHAATSPHGKQAKPVSSL